LVLLPQLNLQVEVDLALLPQHLQEGEDSPPLPIKEVGSALLPQHLQEGVDLPPLQLKEEVDLVPLPQHLKAEVGLPPPLQHTKEEVGLVHLPQSQSVKVRFHLVVLN